jgi:predicted 3-demethylubiquinone-9 3-methyltransferase (glyoxalase superfamily)
MQTIVPHLWFEKGAAKIAELYVKAIPGSRILSQTVLADTPSGTVDLVRLSVAGYEVQLLGAGPEFKVNASLSFMINCSSKDEVDAIYHGLKDGALEMMPLGEYPFSKRYAWLADRHGVSWQLHYAEQPSAKVVPCQMFTGANAGKAAEAMAYYTKLFGGETTLESHYGAGMEPNKPDMINHARFTLKGQTFGLMDNAFPSDFAFNEAVSYIVHCDDQAEIDKYWAALSAHPSAEACGWCKDRFGFSWQIVPGRLGELMSDPAKAGRVSQAFLKMKKLDIAALEQAAQG